jgi:hypothetical protein
VADPELGLALLNKWRAAQEEMAAAGMSIASAARNQQSAKRGSEPVADEWCLVGNVIVHDEIDVEFGRHCGLDLIQELAELGGAMATVALADNLAGATSRAANNEVVPWRV